MNATSLAAQEAPSGANDERAIVIRLMSTVYSRIGQLEASTPASTYPMEEVQPFSRRGEWDLRLVGKAL